jgi:hypothetical protein
MVPKLAEIAEPAETVAVSTPVKPFAEMNEAELAQFDRQFIAALEAGDDSAARASLAAGVPIYYADDDTPVSGVIKKYPDGRKELVTFANGHEIVLQDI